MIGLLGKKLGQTRVYDATGALIPVTVILAGPNRVLQTKTVENDGYKAVQLGFDDQKEHRLTKPLFGHILKHHPKDKGAAVAVKRIKEFRDYDLDLKPGDIVSPKIFAQGDFVDAVGLTKGRGFEGVVKRWNFRGGDMTHGAKGWHRRSGAIGQRLFPGTVMRGMKMPGHMGQAQRTSQNLEIIQVRDDENILLIKGSVPGSKGDYIVIRGAKKGLKQKRVEAPKPAKAAAAAKPAAKPAAKKK